MRIGIFGGTFDPPHMGHLMVGQDAAEALGLDLLLWVPARRSPFKVAAGSTDAGLRVAMLEAALAGHPAFRIWAGELERPAPSYTVDTLEALKLEFPEAALTLLMGGDQWRSFGDWRDPERILELASVGILQRASPEPVESQGPDFPHVFVPVRRVDLSSTEIRERASRGASLRYLVPEAVRRLIEDNALYVTPAGATLAEVENL